MANINFEVGQIWVTVWVTENPDVKRLTYCKIAKLSAAMLWYFRCDKDGSPLNDKVYKISNKNVEANLGQPLAIYEYHTKAWAAIQASHKKYGDFYSLISGL